MLFKVTGAFVQISMIFALLPVRRPCNLDITPLMLESCTCSSDTVTFSLVHGKRLLHRGCNRSRSPGSYYDCVQAFDICPSLHKSAFTSLFLQTIVQGLQVPFVMLTALVH